MTRTGPTTRAGAVILAVALAAGCSSGKKLALGQGCTLNSDCVDPLSCKFGKCSRQCAETRDCLAGETCVKVDGLGVCLSASARDCGGGGSCRAPLVCGPDNYCGSACLDEGACLKNQGCRSGVCFDQIGPVDGGAGDGLGPDPVAWAVRAGGSGTDFGASVAALADGSTYVIGTFNSTVAFGSTTLTSAGGADIYLAKYGPDGSVVWAVRAGGTGMDGGGAVAVLADGSAYATGRFVGTATFGAVTLDSAGSEDIFLAKYNPDGSVVWAKQAGGPRMDWGSSVAALPDGSVYLSGSFTGGATFGSTTFGAAGGTELFIFLAKYNSDGSQVWVQQAGGTPWAQAGALAVMADGSPYLVGTFTSTVVFGATTLASAGGNDIFLARYAPDGSVVWAQKAGGVEVDTGRALGLLPDGSAYVLGSFRATAVFGSTVLASSGDFDVAVAKYNSDGSVAWARQAGGVGPDFSNGLALSANGSVYVFGSFVAALAFDGVSLTPAGLQDVYLAKYRPDDGSVVWALSLGGSGKDTANAIATLGDATAVVLGTFEDTTAFGRTMLTSAGGIDIFLARIDK